MDQSDKTTLARLALRYLATTSVARQLFHVFILILLVMVGTASYVAIKDFRALVRVWTEAHEINSFSANLKISVSNDSQIARDLDAIMAKTNGARAYVYRFHNGLAAINNVPFFFQSMTHEDIAPGTTRILPYEQRIPVGIGMKMNMAFLSNQCIVMKDTDKDSGNANYYYWISRGAKHFVRCPIFMPNGDLFGFVGIDYNAPDSRIEEGQRLLREQADRLAKMYWKE